MFTNARQNFHITVFHFSHPADPRPDAVDPHSGLGHLLLGTPDRATLIADESIHKQHVHGVLAESSGSSTGRGLSNVPASRVNLSCVGMDTTLLPPPYDRPGPTQHQMQREQQVMAEAVDNIGPFVLQVGSMLC